jgi:hypothetical protein
MFDAELEAQVARLTHLLDEAAYKTRRSRRSLERELGLAHGYLGNLFNGRTELKVYHVLLLSKLLDLDPVELLRQALHGESGPPAVLDPDAASVPTAPPPPGPAAASEERRESSAVLDLDRLQELIRQTFRDEVRKLGGNLAKMDMAVVGDGEE